MYMYIYILLVCATPEKSMKHRIVVAWYDSSLID